MAAATGSSTPWTTAGSIWRRTVTGKFQVISPNGWEGFMSADAFGITVCLFAYSNLSFGSGQFAETCAEQYHLLREYMMDHAEAGAILAATD